MTGRKAVSRPGTSCTYADLVAFPDDALADEEEVVLHLHPHAKAAIGPVLVLVLALTGVITAWVMLPATRGGLIGVLLVAAIAVFFGIKNGVRPLLVWRCTHYVITNDRILLQDGVIARERRDLPLYRINDHVMSQTLLERLWGCGTLTVDSIGDKAAVLAAVPHVQAAQTLLYELIDAAPEPDEDGVAEEPGDDAIDVPLIESPAPKQARRPNRARR
jgi:membrane protein YdbS with pleckstrin-like domain